MRPDLPLSLGKIPVASHDPSHYPFSTAPAECPGQQLQLLCGRLITDFLVGSLH